MQRLRSLGQALVELLQAEVDALGADLQGTASELAKALALLAGAAFLLFWVLGGLGYGAMEVLSLWLPRWGAVFTVVGVFALFALILALLGRSRLRRLEAPAATVKRHLASHKEFVRQELLLDDTVDEGASGPLTDGAETEV